MNYCALMGRLTADPEHRQTDSTSVSKYTLAVDRIGKNKDTDFIRCVAFGKASDFAQQYLKKGMKIAVEGRIQTGSYTNKDGQKVYTTDIIVNNHHFCESKGEVKAAPAESTDDFMNLPDNIDDEVPFG